LARKCGTYEETVRELRSDMVAILVKGTTKKAL
jgi:hypothetical protein